MNLRLIDVRACVAVTAAVVLLLLAVGCGSVRAPAQPGAAAVARTQLPPASKSATIAGNEKLARTQARWLMSLVPLPPGAAPLRAAPPSLPGPALGAPSLTSQIDISRSWRLPMPLAQAILWLQAHRPTGLPENGSANGWGPQPSDATAGYSYAGQANAAWQSADLELGVAWASAGTSIMRADAVVIWLDPVPLPDNAPGPRVHVSVTERCPATDEHLVGVTNQGTDLKSRLLPAAAPTAGLECTYYGLNGRPWQLRARVILDAAAARRLAATLARQPLSHTVGGAFNCPLADGSAQIIALAYPGRPDVDVWNMLNGCSYLANGFITTRNPGGIF